MILLVVVAYAALFLGAYLKKKTNKIPTWRLNLMQIEFAKQHWVNDRVTTTNDTPTLDDLRPYLSDWSTNHIFWTNGVIADPDGGVYTIGRIGEEPSCLMEGRRIHL
ncbi:MAG TPA: hypothetical protein VN625_04995 [Desulfuromonadaceae bacterium]|nr:hypothetical protein [Desulfuromonadaceae bacterium]